MKKLLRVVAIGLGGLAGLLLIALLIVYIWSEAILRQHYEAEPEALVKAPPELVAQGYRLGRLHGCLSCHGEGLVGNAVFEAPLVGDIIAPNLTKLVRRSTDEELSIAIRQGIAPDGRGLLVMPSAVAQRMPPEETAALVARMRSLPEKEG